MRSRLALWLVTLFLSPVSVFAGELPRPPKEPPQALAGSLVIAGGGPLPDSVIESFIKLAGGPNSRIVLIPTASASADRDTTSLVELWKKRGAGSVSVLHTRSKEKANDPEFIKLLTEATGVWLGGGDQSKITAAYKGTAVEAELHKLLGRRGVIGGTSAGAAVMSRLMIAGGTVPPRLGEGLGFLPGGVIDQHFLKRKRMDRLLDVLAKHPGWFGLGIDEETAVIVQGRSLTVAGKSQVIVCQAAGKDRPASTQTLKPGERADLVALSRAALARAQDPHPPAKPPLPQVVKGALIIGGGGGMPDEVWKKFIELAGGPKARIVYIPTALDNPERADFADTKRLKKHGAPSIKVLHAKSRADANRPEFVKAIDEAKGLWFSGGRQWRLVDAYERTAAEKAFHDLLARGGVIGGSSAGASIQADYMVRGDPLGNLKMMAEGYERGLGFLKGVAIDQHFIKRKRTADMTELMRRYPQLLGIGIDEATALLVQGEVMEVMGKSDVLIYDRTRPMTGDNDYEPLAPGARFNLRTRQTLEKN